MAVSYFSSREVEEKSDSLYCKKNGRDDVYHSKNWKTVLSKEIFRGTVFSPCGKSLEECVKQIVFCKSLT